MRTKRLLYVLLALTVSLSGTVAFADTETPATTETRAVQDDSDIPPVTSQAVTESTEPEENSVSGSSESPLGQMDSSDVAGTEPASNAGSVGSASQLSSKPSVTASLSGDGSITLSWKAVEGASAYAVAEKLPSGSFRTFTYGCTDTSYVVSNLSCGVNHRFLVQAKVNGSWTSFDESDLVAITPEGPTKPVVKATASNGSIRLDWGAVPGADRYAIALRRAGSSSWKTVTYDCHSTSYSITGLRNGADYEFVVQAARGGSWTDFSSADIVASRPYDATSPVVSAAATGDGQVTLSWEAVSGADAYAIAEKMSDGTYKTFSLNETGTSYVVSGLVNGVSHKFLVQARVNGHWSSISDDLLVCCAPTGATKPTVTLSVGECSVHLAWNRVSGASRYLVVSSYGKSYSVSADSNTLDLTGLRNGVSYSFCVRAQLQGSWSKALDSDWVSCTPSPSDAPAPVVSETTDNSILLSWDSVPGASSYAVAVKTATGYKTYTLDCAGTSFRIDGLAAGREYRFLVQALVNGKWSAYSDSNLVLARTSNQIAPVASAEPSDDSSVLLKWNSVPGATKYAVAERVDGGYKTFSYSVTGTSYTVEGLSKSVTHRFLVQAFVNGKWSVFSDDNLVSVSLEDEHSPKVTGSCTGDGQVTLTWAPIPGATKYAVAEYVNGSYKTYTLDCAGNSYVVSNLSNGYEHHFLVQAFVNGIWSSFGDAVLCSVVPHGTVSPTCHAVSADYSVKLDWNAVPGATRYAIAVKTDGGYKTYTYNCTGTSYEVAGLNGSTSYEFIVQAFVGGKWSMFSEADLVGARTTGRYMTESERLMNERVTNGWYSSATRYLILVDTSRNEVGIYSGTGNAGSWNMVKLISCTSGASNTPTVKGTFTVGSRGIVFGDGYSCWYWTQFYKDYLFHSVLYYPGSQSHVMDGRLGINASHGCVRLEIQNAKWIYDNIPSGTKVVIY